MALVTLILLLFLGNARAALITALNIPLALLAAFCGMVATGTPANLISHRRRRLRHRRRLDRHRDGEHLPLPRDARPRTDPGPHPVRGARQVARPLSFATLIIGVAFLPLFTMTGVAGVIFSPMAHTYAFAIGARDHPRAHADAGAHVEAHPRRRPRRRTASRRAHLKRALPPDVRRSRSGRPKLALADRARAGRPRARRSSRRSAASSCRSSRRATSGSARRCRRACRSSSPRSTSGACARSCAGAPSRAPAPRRTAVTPRCSP